jgi:aspartate-semialdehyde dehydrogenase
MEELRRTSAAALAGEAIEPGPVFPHPIAFNCLPQIDVFTDDGYTKEEHKMMFETRKIFDDQTIRVSATCVRVPVLVGHAEAINVEFEKPLSPEEARDLLAVAPGVELLDAPLPHAMPLRGTRSGPGRPDPPRPVAGEHARPVDRGRQPAQGRGAERRADRGAIAAGAALKPATR